MIITIGGTKGGCGKTTTATNLAIYLVLQGSEVLLVDADEQKTATDFSYQRQATLNDTGYTAIQLTGAAVRSQVLKQKEKYDHIVIDVGGRDTDGLRAALTVSDVLLSPFKPKNYDIWTLDKIEKLVTEAEMYNENLKSFSFINEAFTHSKVKDNAEAAQSLNESKIIKFLGVQIGNRKVFSDSVGEGLSVFEIAKDKKAIAEFEGLYNSFMEELSIKA
jgi:chromosome partitioning protein